VHTHCEPVEILRNAQELLDEFHHSHPGKPRLWRQENNLPFILSFILLTGCGLVQMASAQVLAPSDHCQVMVECPSAVYPQHDRGNYSLFGCLSLYLMGRCSPGGLRLRRG